MSEAEFPLLSFIILLPLLGAVAIGFIRDIDLAKIITLCVASFVLFLTLFVVLLFDNSQSGFQLVENYAWIPSLNVEYFVGVDGISVLFLPLTALLTLIAILASWRSTQNNPRFHFALLLALEGITIGVFCALDMMLFLLFWELTLPPLFFLIGLWGIGSQRRGAAMKYTLYMLFGGVPLLLAIILLAVNHSSQVGGAIPYDLAFSLPVLLETSMPADLQTVVFLLFLLGFAIKAPLVPFHTWLPTASMEGPTHVVALLVGLKLGIYGILRFTLPLAPIAAIEFSWILSIIGVITLMYGALIALQQTNLRRLLAFSSISHVGMVIIGIASLNIQGVQGAVFQLINFTLVASSLMLVAGFIQSRIGSTDAVHLGGMAKVMPRLTCLYFIFALASIGIPGTSGFPAELLMIIGALTSHTGLGIAALAGAILGAAYMLSFTRRAFFGPIKHTDVAQAHDLKTRELALLCFPAFLILLFGFFPDSILNINQLASEAWLSRLTVP
ncbi:MAG: NADH-quinone oxidoreductase subunit M [Betaproteobacteria bacterium]|nr:NADH-quinone oxidoreductase subunit M [Betaproteobacteria bacterium]